MKNLNSLKINHSESINDYKRFRKMEAVFYFISNLQKFPEFQKSVKVQLCNLQFSPCYDFSPLGSRRFEDSFNSLIDFIIDFYYGNK